MFVPKGKVRCMGACFPLLNIQPEGIFRVWPELAFSPGPGNWSVPCVEGFYCKRPIQCLASSEIFAPHPLTARRVCTPPPLVRCGVRTHSLGGEGEGGGFIVRKTSDTALYSIYVSTLWSPASCICRKVFYCTDISLEEEPFTHIV